jgi:hypothetical protein
MAVEPVSQTAAGVGLAIPISVAAGTLFGVEYPVIAFAFLGGMLVLLYLDRMDWKRCAFSVAASTFVGSLAGQWLGTLFAALAVYGTFYFVPALDPLSVAATVVAPIKLTIAFVSGLCSQKAIPALFRRMRRWGEGDVGEAK